MFKPMLLFVFFPNKVNKNFIDEKIHIRETLLALFIVECCVILVALLSKYSNDSIISIIMLAILLALFGTYFWGAFQTGILYLFDRIMLKRISTYKSCFKLMLPYLIIDGISPFINALIQLVGSELANIGLSIFSVSKLIWFIFLLSYYLKRLYICKTIHIIGFDVVYLTILCAPKALNYLLF